MKEITSGRVHLILVHGSHLKQKKFVGTKSLGITPS